MADAEAVLLPDMKTNGSGSISQPPQCQMRTSPIRCSKSPRHRFQYQRYQPGSTCLFLGELLLKILAVDDVMIRTKGGWQATGEPWVYDTQRYEHVAAQRVAEQDLMINTSAPSSVVCVSYQKPWMIHTPPIVVAVIIVWVHGTSSKYLLKLEDKQARCCRDPALRLHHDACGPPGCQISGRVERQN